MTSVQTAVIRRRGLSTTAEALEAALAALVRSRPLPFTTDTRDLARHGGPSVTSRSATLRTLRSGLADVNAVLAPLGARVAGIDTSAGAPAIIHVEGIASA